MSNSSSAGDNLGISVGRNPTMGSSGGVSGWFDIKHWCAETDTIFDYSGPNCIYLSGVHHMLRGLTSNGTAAGVTAATIKTGIWVSGTTGNIARGASAVTSGHDSLTCADATGTTDTLFPGAATSVNLSSGTNMGSSTKGVWFSGAGELDIFTTAPTVSLPNISIESAALVLTSFGTQTVNSIFVADQTVATNPTRAEILLLAVRTVTSGAQASEDMTAVVLQNGDTLTITYTLQIAVA
jgi:hypothetical protein